MFSPPDIWCNRIQGCIVFILPPAPGDCKNMIYCLLGKKYDDLFRKSADKRGKRWEKRGKEKIFNVPRFRFYKLGEKISFLEREGTKSRLV